MTSGRARAALTATLAGLPLYALLVARFDFVCDDAFISFRYARHLAGGLGLRYNLGVEPPVTPQDMLAASRLVDRLLDDSVQL